MKETAKQHYQKQLKTLHDLSWKIECYHVSELNRMNENGVSWGDCGKLNTIIEKIKEVISIMEE